MTSDVAMGDYFFLGNFTQHAKASSTPAITQPKTRRPSHILRIIHTSFY